MPGGKDRKVHFALEDKSAREVFLAGAFNGWDGTALPLKHDGAGVWSADIELPPGRHEYLFVTDGCWRPDPTAEQVRNEFGGVNSVVTLGTFTSL